MPGKSAAEWRVLVDRWLSSGQCRTEFAAANGLNVNTLSWWRSQFAREKKSLPAATFAEVVVEDERTAPDLIVELGDGLRVRVPAGFDATELRRLVDALC